MRRSVKFILMIILIFCFAGCCAEAEEGVLNMPEGLKVVEQEAFYQSQAFRELVLPEGVKELHSLSFARSGVTSAYLPESLTFVAVDAFLECEDLVVTVHRGSYAHEFCEENKIEYVFLEADAADFTYTVNDDGTVTITGYLGSDAVLGIPSEIEGYPVTKIDSNAFTKHTTITKVFVPESVTSIGKEAFKNCSALEAVFMHEGLTEVGQSAFENCNVLKTADLPDSVETIGSYAFRNCAELHSFHYPKSLAAVGDHGKILIGCEQLKVIEIPEGVTTIPERAFKGCDYIEEVKIPDSVVAVGAFAFEDCTSLKHADLPDSVQKIATRLYSGCVNLETFNYPASLEVFDDAISGHSEILEGCKLIQVVEIPEGIKKVPRLMFKGCNYIQKVILPDTVTEIEEYAFEKNERLEYIYIHPRVTVIGKDAFKGCKVVTIYTEYGARAHHYAVENGHNYFYLSLTDSSVPQGTVYQGEHFPLYGFVRSTVPVETVTATIWNADQSKTLQTVTINPGETDYDLSGYINSHLYVENLPLGTYWFGLTATAGEETDTYGSWKFTTVPAPVRVTGKLYMLKDIVDPSKKFSGYVTSNYDITEFVIKIAKTNGEVKISKTYTPNAKTFDLAAAAADFDLSTLPMEDYVLTMSMTANGETRTIAKSYFTVAIYDGNVDQDTFNAVVNFVREDANRSIFSKYNYRISEALADMDIDTVFTMVVSDYKDILWNQFKDFVVQNGYDSYLVKLYKAEIIELLKEVAGNNSSTSGDAEFRAAVVQALKTNGSLTVETVKKFYGKAMSKDLETLIKELDGIIDELDYTVDAIKQLDALAEMVDIITTDYTKELALMDMVDELTADRNDESFTQAMLEIRAEFRAKWFGVLYKSINAAIDQFFDKAVDESLELVVEAISGSKVGYGVLTFALDLSLELSGTNDDAANVKTFFAQQASASNAENAYTAMFNAIESGQTSSENIQKFITTFIYARQAYYRIYATMEDMTNNYEEENEIWMDRMDISLLVIPGTDMSGIID